MVFYGAGTSYDSRDGHDNKDGRDVVSSWEADGDILRKQITFLWFLFQKRIPPFPGDSLNPSRRHN
jgi:hypothetical protein